MSLSLSLSLPLRPTVAATTTTTTTTGLLCRLAFRRQRWAPPPTATTIQSASSSRSRQSSSSRPPPPPPPFPTVATCPAPTCGCAPPPPPMPPGLDIDRKSPLNGVMSGYAEQVLVCTGEDDWPSRIEEENGGDNLAADLKELFGRGGVYSDPFHNISILNASLPSSVPPRREVQSTSAYLLPSFKYVPFLPRVSFDSVQALAKGYLLPERLHAAHDGLSPIHRDRLTRKHAYRALLPGACDVRDVLVLVCGHGGRDVRCGVVGPLLRDEFEACLEREGVDVLRGPVEVDLSSSSGSGDGATAPRLEAATEGNGGEGGGRRGAGSGGEAATAVQQQQQTTTKTARVALISHIGGHKFAGNVIIYVPPGQRLDDGKTAHPLAGHGIWYGRVEPRHVEGLVRETVLRGTVVEDMFRGGIDAQRRILRL
ncbi:Altered inheritance of mitochondria protein 32 [Purpureocillium takamizusanense]|uniref:Altered inheritance of mitochondria protein 32 n=1 Tax=Purpureocillium takamizusanense TaxID=2060973 RepID=A0A9Q8QGX4_9HYPO|nr:Altered inheritance of mitochondria protein 32 [Purpureocillium takamizusanense]UNI18661.1 Altered inheritance of mitochondria protein 32 [Purpureocillium takamizusanense]